MSDHRWKEIARSPHDHERNALEWLRSRLPDEEPVAAWTNFEFTDRNGRTHEVDALVMTRAGLFLVEIKSWTGRLVAGAGVWDYTSPGNRQRIEDNPRRLANLKARVLGGLLRDHWDRSLRGRPPYVQELVWLSEVDIDVRIEDRGEFNLVFHAAKQGFPPADRALLDGDFPGARRDEPLHRQHRRWLEQAMRRIGVRPRQDRREVQGWILGEPLDEGPRHQDVEATKGNRKRRVRFFLHQGQTSRADRERLCLAARREFEALGPLRHHAELLVADDFVEHERGPALLYDLPESLLRLDHFLAVRGHSLDTLQRLDLVRALARAVQYAHDKGVVHRALCPQSVLLHRDWPRHPLEVRIADWHTAHIQESTLTATRHIDDWMDEKRAVFLAPEALDPQHLSRGEPPPTTDVYGLGALLSLLLTGEPPAESVAELQARWQNQKALAPATHADGIDARLDALVRKATAVIPADRHATLGLLADALDRLRAELATELHDEADPDEPVDPLLAEPGHQLMDRFTVEAILGKGSTARALLVKDREYDGDCVLKIALEPSHHDRLDHESRALGRLDSPHVVRLLDHLTLEPHGRHALLLEFGGRETLREKLRNKQLNLDELQRFGEELCTLLMHLEEAGVLHRDLKPENLGIHAADPKQARRLVAWDFSLAGTPLDTIKAGTPGYMDPYLHRPDRPGVDEHADRWAAATTLHEMATGQKPTFPSDTGLPHLNPAARISLASHLFPESIARRLTDFFERAFQPDHRHRFDTAAQMRDAWQDVFATTTHGTLDPQASDLEARLATLTLPDPLAKLGLSDAAHDVLQDHGVRTLDDFVRKHGNELVTLPTSGPVRDEIRLAWRSVRFLIPGATRHDEDDAAAGARTPEHYTIDDLVDFLWEDRKRSALPDTQQELAAALLLPNPPAETDPGTPRAPAGEWRWPDAVTHAAQLGQPLGRFNARVDELAVHWSRKKFVAPLLADVQRLLGRHGGILSAGELARALAGLRGCLNDAHRLRWSRAVVRAVALLLDHGTAGSEAFRIERTSRALFFVSAGVHDGLVGEFGTAADLALEDVELLQPEVAWASVHDLLPLEQRTVLSHLGRTRGLQVAAMASGSAAAGSRGELYRAGAPADLLLPSLARRFSHVERVTESELRHALAERFPDAQVLPGLPDLARLIRDAGLGLERAADLDGESVWEGRRMQAASGSSMRSSTQLSTTRSVDEGERLVREVDHQLGWRRREGGFTAVMCRLRSAERLAPLLADRHELELVSAEAMWLDALRESVEARSIAWSLVLSADAAAPEEKDHRNFRTLLTREVIPRMDARLQALDGPVLLHRNGLFARYGAMHLIERLREYAGRPGWPPVVWMLLPVEREQDRPVIDGTDVPLIHPSERYRLPRLWEARAMG